MLLKVPRTISSQQCIVLPGVLLKDSYDPTTALDRMTPRIRRDVVLGMVLLLAAFQGVCLAVSSRAAMSVIIAQVHMMARIIECVVSKTIRQNAAKYF